MPNVPNDMKVILYSNRAQSYINIKRYKEAETDCLLALEIDCNHAKSLHRCGVARYYLKDFRESKKALERALTLTPNQTDILTEIAQVKQEIEKVRKLEIEKMIERGKLGRKERVIVKVEDINEDEGLRALEQKRKELENELKNKPKKGVEAFLSDDEDNELDQLS